MPLKMSYETAKKRAEPYTKIVEELSQMRRDAVQLVRQAVGAGRRAYVLVHNRVEGNAPLTSRSSRRCYGVNLSWTPVTYGETLRPLCLAV